MSEWLRCDLHGAYDGNGECPCCWAIGQGANRRQTLAEMRANSQREWQERAVDLASITLLATLEVENATLRRQLAAAHEALAAATLRQDGAEAPALTERHQRLVAPLERATGVGMPQTCQAVLAAISRKVVR